MKRMAIIRGASLNKFEMQSYELLSGDFYLEAFSPRYHWYDIDDLKFKVTRLHSLEGIPGRIYSSAFFSRIPLVRKAGAKAYFSLGIHNSYMAGLGQRLKGFDVVNTAETFTNYSDLAVRMKKRYGFKTAVTVWENMPFSHETSRRERAYKKNVIRNADMFIAVTGRTQAMLMQEGVPAEKIRVIPAGIDTERFKSGAKDRALMQRFNIEEQDVVILFVGRLERHKGIFTILESAKALLDDAGIRRQLKFMLVGKGDERDAILRAASKSGIEANIILTGPSSYGEIDRFYKIADIFVLPSVPVAGWQEQFGVSLVEAMASSLPVVSTNTGSIPDVVGDSGILIEPDSPQALMVELKRLILDEGRRRELGRSARERAERLFSKEAVSRKLREVHAELLR